MSLPSECELFEGQTFHLFKRLNFMDILNEKILEDVLDTQMRRFDDVNRGFQPL